MTSVKLRSFGVKKENKTLAEHWARELVKYYNFNRLSIVFLNSKKWFHCFAMSMLKWKLRITNWETLGRVPWCDLKQSKNLTFQVNGWDGPAHWHRFRVLTVTMDFFKFLNWAYIFNAFFSVVVVIWWAMSTRSGCLCEWKWTSMQSETSITWMFQNSKYHWALQISPCYNSINDRKGEVFMRFSIRATTI